MNSNFQARNRRGQVSQGMIIGLVIAGLVVVGGIIAYAIHRNGVEVAKTNSQAHIAACKELQNQIQGQHSPLSNVGLKFQPYQSRFDAAARDQKTAEAVLDRDPKAADKLAGDAETQFKAVLADLHLAIEVKTDNSGVTAVDDAENRVSQARGQSVEFNYPGEASGRSETLRLNEQGNNPDGNLAAARRALGTIGASLDAGNPKSAAESLRSAKSEAAAAVHCINRAHSAKKRVESEMSAVQQKAEGSDSAFEAGVKSSYYEQNFVSAANRMDALNKRIEDRKETREVLSFCQRLQRDVARALEDNASYTSTATDQRFQSLKDQLNGLAESVKQDNANWADLKAAGQKLEKGLNAVRDEALQARRDYDDAVFAVKSFRRDYEDADRAGTPPLTFFSQSLHPDVTDSVKEKVTDINAVSTRIERQIKLSKQDWRQVKRDADEAVRLLKEAKQAVEDDSKKLDELLSLKAQLKEVTSFSRYSCTVNGRTFNSGDSNRRDGDFNSHADEATERYNVAARAWRAGEKVGFADAVRSLKKEISTVNNIGWYNMLRMMRSSSDPVAQRISWNNGFRDDKTRTEWVDGFVSKRATGSDGLWTPDVKSTSGGAADFGPGPDFKAPWN